MKKIILILPCIFLTTLIQSQNIWQQSGPNSGSIGSFCVTTNNNLLTGTNAGIFRSTNNGNTWIKSNFSAPGFSPSVNSIIKNVNGNIFACGSFTGVYMSSDDGINWIQRADTTIGFFSMCTTPNGYLYGSIPYQGIWKSTNNGVHWVRGYQPISQYPWMFASQNGYIFTAVDYGIIRSTDSGNTWEQVGYGLIYTPSKAFSDDATGNVYCGNYFGVFKSTNSGTNWVRLTNAPTVVWSLTCDPNGNVYCGSGDGTIYKSTDGGNTWINLYTSPVQGSANQVWTLTSTLSGNVFGGLAYTGIVRTLNNGNSWERINAGLTNGFISCLNAVSGNTIFAGTYNDGLHKSTNNGISWTLSSLENIYVFSIGSNNSGHLFVSTNYPLGVLRSTNDGANWTKINSGLNANFVQVFVTKPPSFVFAATQNGFYMSSNNGDSWALTGFSMRYVSQLLLLDNGDLLAGVNGIYRSTNNGLNWILLDSITLSSNQVRSLVKSPTGFLLASSDHLYKSTDNGNTWTMISELSFNTLAINSMGYIVGGSSPDGIKLSTDGGYTWAMMHSGIPLNHYTGDLIIDSLGYFYFTTWGSSVYRTVRNIVSINPVSTEIPEQFSLSQNYPNPFNPVTSFKLQVSSLKHVKILVFDVLGREVATLVNEQLSPGTYEVDWDGSNFSSGIYYYTLQTEGYSETRKMVLMK